MSIKKLNDDCDYRLKKFNIIIEDTRYPDFEGEINVKVTYNGRQYTNISLAPHEIDILIEKINDYKKGNNV